MSAFDISVFKDIFSLDGKERYIELNNTVGQRWYIPFHNHSYFMSLFQPSSVKGRLFAKTLNLVKHFPKLLNIAYARIVSLSFSKEFQSLIDGVFCSQNCKFGIFCGSPGHHQKLTLLVSNGKSILGYCKLTDKTEIYNLFTEECRNLEYLHSKGIENVPTALHCGKLDFCNLYAFVQTTERRKRMKQANYLSRELIDFVKDVNKKTEQKIAFDDSDFAHALIRLQSNFKYLKSRQLCNIIENGIKYIENNKNLFGEFYASHGDLTAWNSFIVDDHLFVFDLEYFKQSYPLLCDYFHFFTQDMLYNGYADANKIWDKYKDVKKIFLETNQLDIYFVAYLLIIIDFYLSRDSGILNERLESCFAVWTELIEKLIDDDKKIN